MRNRQLRDANYQDPTHAHAGGSRRARRSDRSLTSVLRRARVWLSPQCPGLPLAQRRR